MKHPLFVLIVLVATIIPRSGKAGDTLQVSEAIAVALENNFKITLAENEKQVAAVNNTIGAAGMLPQLGLTGSRSRSVNNTRQEYFDGRLREAKDAGTTSKSAGLQLTWTVFDGLNMFIQKDKLNELENLSDIQLRSVVENTVSQVLGTYYEIVAQEALREVYRNALRISGDRRRFAKAKFDLGSGSELALLQATVDLNSDSANFIRQTSLINNLKSELNLLMCRELDQPVVVAEKIPVKKDLVYQDLLQKLQNQNPDLLTARNAISLASLAVKELKSQQLPRINLNSSYNYSQSKSDVGLLTSNRNYGYTVGLSLSYNIFDGFTNRQKISAARINMESARVQLENAKMETEAGLKQVYNDYQTNLKLVDFETKSLDFARHNFAVASEKYRLGSLNDIEFRETQAKLMEAENRLLSALYRCMLAETELLRLSGQLSASTE